MKKRFAKFPSSFGKLDLRQLCAVARNHGMEIIAASKPDMHCYNEIGLFGSPEGMKATEAEWTAAGNELKPRGFTAVFNVPVGRSRSEWVDTKIAEARARAIHANGDAWPFRLRNGKSVDAPAGYRQLTTRELPRESDIAWNAGAEVFEPLDLDGLGQVGPKRFKECAHGILRRKGR